MEDYYYRKGYRNLSDIIGKTFESVTGLAEGSDEIIFKFTDGTVYKMYHDQDCCESVQVDDVCGDLDDLIGGVVVDAREDTNSEDPLHLDSKYLESFTWTFYNIQTTKGHVNIRWLGESNGYYSESVDFKIISE